MSEMKTYIFISYAHKNIEKAKKIKAYFTENNYEVWFDEQRLHDGFRFDDFIADGIYHASLFVSLISNEYVNQDYCNKEITYAFNQHKNILPIYLDHYRIKAGTSLDLYLSGISAAAYGKGLYDENDYQMLWERLNVNPYLLAYNDYLNGSHSKPMPYLENEKIYYALKAFYLKSNLVNYFGSDIKEAMFPPFEINHQYYEEENNNEALVQYLKNHRNKHFMIVGKGGSGKTIALRTIFQAFIQMKYKILYIPLGVIRKDTSIENYLKEELGMNYDLLRRYGSVKNETPLILLVDGLNEAQKDFQDTIHDLSMMMRWDNTQVIMSSRIDYSEYFNDEFLLECIKLQSIHKDKLSLLTDINQMSENMISLISNPLMLKLYMDTDRKVLQMDDEERYGSYYPIHTTLNPSNEIEVMWNYLMSQVFKMEKNYDGKQICHTLVVVEWILPYLAYHMMIDPHKQLSDKTFISLLKQAKKEVMNDYIDERMDDVAVYLNLDEYEVNLIALRNTIKKLSILEYKEESKEYLFFHQCFRDFFTSLYLTKKIEDDPLNECFTEMIYDQDIIEYVALMVKEEKMLTKAMKQWKHQHGEKIQNAVANYFQILDCLNHHDFSHHDLSYLDLRKCILKNKKFVTWNQQQQQCCNFEGSYIDMACFIKSGHLWKVTALKAYSNCFLSSDERGVIKKWSYQSKEPLKTIDSKQEGIIDLLYDEQEKRWYILSQHNIMIYDEKNDQLSTTNQTTRYYHKIRMNQKKEIEVSYDLKPLTYYDLKGNVVEAVHDDLATRIAIISNDRSELYRRFQNKLLYMYKQKNNQYHYVKKIDFIDYYMKMKNDGSYSINPKKFLLKCKQEPLSEEEIHFLEKIKYDYSLQNEVLCLIIEISFEKYGQLDYTFMEKTCSLFNDLGINRYQRALGYLKKERIKQTVINAMKIHLLNNTLLVACGKELFEFKQFELVKRTIFDSYIHQIEILENGNLLISSASSIYYTDPNLNVIQKYEGGGMISINKWFIVEGNIYIFDQNNMIKKLNQDLIVQKIRKLPLSSKRVMFGTYGLKDKRKVIFSIVKDEQSENGNESILYGYDFEKDEVFKIEQPYEIYTWRNDFTIFDKDYDVINDIELYSIDKKSLEVNTFLNRSAIYIYGCNFMNIKGSIVNEEGLKFLKENGGILCENK